ncbi:hypothetical protein P175DRAFT_0533792 [Aspergillus ochraceoroseus IBT 24754]|uniref:non-specific serine/threonine protein kinase n=1 Tax=Aspergillus ochraceoroseus IBT 24754 TaxID=1392256 RepID=A0A2T5LSU8_9EURO|nr:uncharacterized protein P175DRAFT_0533792 [Aspergillus ochraceoroseus IBT 24754]PTU19358.1 hypothetical protein P175DRAFT_0533792 [Aspergillus ochraceoroseus IBT 24754]
MRDAIRAATQGSVMDSEERSCLRSDTFVFTHHDLAPRNVLLSPSEFGFFLFTEKFAYRIVELIC